MKIPEAVQKALSRLSANCWDPAQIKKVMQAVYENPPLDTKQYSFGDGWNQYQALKQQRNTEQNIRDAINELRGVRLTDGHWYECSDGKVRQAIRWEAPEGESFSLGCSFFYRDGRYYANKNDFTILREVKSTDPQPGERWMTEQRGAVLLRRWGIDRLDVSGNHDDSDVWNPNGKPCNDFTREHYGRLLYRVEEVVRPTPFVNRDYAELDRLSSEFLSFYGPGFFKDDNAMFQAFKKFRDLAMTIAGKRHEQVVQPPPPDPIEAVQKALDSRYGHAGKKVLVALEEKQITGLKKLINIIPLMRDNDYVFPGTEVMLAARDFREAIK